MNTIFFAAGASYDFFEPNLSTQYLTQKVCDKVEWEKVIKKYKSILGDDIVVADADIVCDIISKVVKLNPNINFEQLAEVIDKLSSYSMDFIPQHNMLNLIELSLMEVMKIKGNRLLGIGLQQIPFLFRQIIAEAILDLENNHRSSDYNTLMTEQKQLVSYIKEGGGDLSVISTNYDDCVLKSLEGLDIKDGVRVVDNIHGTQVDIHDFMTASSVTYYPHGHLRYQMTDNMQVTVWGDVNEANERRWLGLAYSKPSTAYVFNDAFSYNFNTFITTGQTKDSSFNNLPYSIFYQRMAIDFAKSRNIIIIGYSFGDEHFNRLLHAYLQLDPSHHIFVVDYYQREITMTTEGTNSSNLLVKIQNVLQQPWLLKKDVRTNALLPFYNEEVQRLNALGYGEIFPQVTFYKKGYAAFLKEYSDVIDINVL